MNTGSPHKSRWRAIAEKLRGFLRFSSPFRLIIAHWVDSLVTCLIAAAVVAGLQAIFPSATRAIVEHLFRLGVVGLLTAGALTFAAVGVICPSVLLSAAAGVKWSFALKHLGIPAKAVIACAIYLSCQSALGVQPSLSPVWSDWAFLACAVAVGWLVAWAKARFVPGAQGRGKAAQAQPQDWLADDQPIASEAQSEFPEHSNVASRILSRLMLPGAPHGAGPNVALIGPYGSGKTSICNLVEEAYGKGRNEHADWPDAIFCRFEAWPYLTPLAAVRGLLGSITTAVLSIADIAELWRVPEQYLAALAEADGTWGRGLSSVLGARPTPRHVATQIGAALSRLGMRLIVFVDDLDRIEESAPDAQRAITQALNQLQGSPAIQYVIAAGPTPGPRVNEAAGRPAHDLLKLTRYQEFVPRLNVKDAMDHVWKARERVLVDGEHYYPWADEGTVSAYQSRWAPLVMPPVVDAIMELVGTPRSLKSALRETESAWRGGLDGEINWDDLLLACALKAAEPSLFEWIERDRETLIYPESADGHAAGNDDAHAAQAARLKKSVFARLSRRTPDREKTVLNALERLFPAFAQRMSDSLCGGDEPALWEQRIACTPDHGRPYFERFLFGRVHEDDTPDQPTLQFIKRVQGPDVASTEFKGMFLSTVEKQTGVLNKFVQFGGLLHLDRALEIGRIIVDWVAVPEHAAQWHETPYRYYTAMFADVADLFGRAGDREGRQTNSSRVAFFKGKAGSVVKWAEDITDYYAVSNWLLPWSLLEMLSPSKVSSTNGNGWRLSSKSANVLRDRLAERLVEKYVLGDGVLTSAMGDEDSLNREFLTLFTRHPEYEKHRTAFTQRLIDEAEEDDSLRVRAALILALVACRIPSPHGSKRRYTVDQERNAERYDMRLVVPALKRWKGAALPDKLVAEALDELLSKYDSPKGQKRTDEPD